MKGGILIKLGKGSFIPDTGATPKDDSIASNSLR